MGQPYRRRAFVLTMTDKSPPFAYCLHVRFPAWRGLRACGALRGAPDGAGAISRIAFVYGLRMTVFAQGDDHE